MKLSQWLLLLLMPVHLFGQDTISIYFESGQSKIQDNQLMVLNAIPVNYDLSTLDSVYFMGMADSVGDFKANIKLSMKRAENTARFCKRIIPENILVKINALGERTNFEKQKNRRVDIILYFQPVVAEKTEQAEIRQAKEACYTIDYELLHRCHIRTVKKGKKEWAMLETTFFDPKKKKEYFYGSVDNKRDFIPKPVKWASKVTGNLWWAKNRYVATIPKDDFDRYKLFRIENLPCSDCNENFQNQSKILKEDTCAQVDRFLMENIQFRVRWFNHQWVTIRAPRVYVNLEDHYFIGCNFENEMIWETRKGKRKQNYFYSKLPLRFTYIENITRLMECCKSNPEPSQCDIPLIYIHEFGKPNSSFLLNLETGSYYQQLTVTPYAGLAISKENIYNRVSISAGTDIDFNFYGSLRYQYHFLSFSFQMLNPYSLWESPSEQKVIDRYGRLYLGSELKTRMNKTKQNFLEQNIHIGLAAINTSVNAFIPRIFLQYGLGYDYLGNYSKEIYSIVQVGIDMKIARLNKNKFGM